MQSDGSGTDIQIFFWKLRTGNDLFWLDELAKALLSRGTWSHTHIKREEFHQLKITAKLKKMPISTRCKLQDRDIDSQSWYWAC